MHLHSSAPPGIVVIALQRDDATAICAPGGDAEFQIPEQILREVRLLLTGRNSDFHMHAAHLAIAHGRSEEKDEWQLAFPRKPETILEAADRCCIADIDFVILQRTKRDWKGSSTQQVRDG